MEAKFTMLEEGLLCIQLLREWVNAKGIEWNNDVVRN